MKTIKCLLLAALALAATSGCDSVGGIGKATKSPVYDATRDEVFDAMISSFDATYDLDVVDRKAGKVTTFYDMSHAAALFSQDGWRTKGEGRIVEAKLEGEEEKKGYQAEIKVFFETNTDQNQPTDPRASTAKWRKDGVNPTLAQRVIDTMDGYLLDFGPSEQWKRANERK